MKYIIGNWKMFPQTIKEAKAIVSGTRKAAAKTKRTKVVICPPSIYLPLLVVKGKTHYGIQDVHKNDEGAHTGETSARGAKSIGAEFVIVGHSERRAMGETNEMVAEKLAAVARNGLTTILCVGEKKRDEDGAYFAEVREQLIASLAKFPKAKVKQLIIAYEPIWAIGSAATRVATPDDLHEMVILIKKTLVHIFGKQHGFRVPILYGGSVDDQNALGFMTKGNADGLLVGRVSLDQKKFSNIIKLAESIQ
jgi:triosephosphate isomerase